MPKAEQNGGDPALHALFERFNAQVVLPGARRRPRTIPQAVYTLGQRGRIRVFHSSEKDKWSETGAKWTYIPIIDLARYADDVGRPFPEWDRKAAERAEQEAEARGLKPSDDSPTLEA